MAIQTEKQLQQQAVLVRTATLQSLDMTEKTAEKAIQKIEEKAVLFEKELAMDGTFIYVFVFVMYIDHYIMLYFRYNSDKLTSMIVPTSLLLVVKVEKEIVQDAVKVEKEIIKDAVAVEKAIIKDVEQVEDQLERKFFGGNREKATR
jgi:hypothetical protein